MNTITAKINITKGSFNMKIKNKLNNTTTNVNIIPSIENNIFIIQVAIVTHIKKAAIISKILIIDYMVPTLNQELFQAKALKMTAFVANTIPFEKFTI